MSLEFGVRPTFESQFWHILKIVTHTIRSCDDYYMR